MLSFACFKVDMSFCCSALKMFFRYFSLVKKTVLTAGHLKIGSGNAWMHKELVKWDYWLCFLESAGLALWPRLGFTPRVFSGARTGMTLVHHSPAPASHLAIQDRARVCSHSSTEFLHCLACAEGGAPQNRPIDAEEQGQGKETECLASSCGWKGDMFSFDIFIIRTGICTKIDSSFPTGCVFHLDEFLFHFRWVRTLEGAAGRKEAGWSDQREPQDSSYSELSNPEGFPSAFFSGEGWWTSLSSFTPLFAKQCLKQTYLQTCWVIRLLCSRLWVGTAAQLLALNKEVFKMEQTGSGASKRINKTTRTCKMTSIAEAENPHFQAATFSICFTL